MIIFNFLIKPRSCVITNNTAVYAMYAIECCLKLAFSRISNIPSSGNFSWKLTKRRGLGSETGTVIFGPDIWKRELGWITATIFYFSLSLFVIFFRFFVFYLMFCIIDNFLTFFSVYPYFEGVGTQNRQFPDCYLIFLSFQIE